MSILRKEEYIFRIIFFKNCNTIVHIFCNRPKLFPSVLRTYKNTFAFYIPSNRVILKLDTTKLWHKIFMLENMFC